jgi:N-acetylneuraminate synthase
MGAAPLKLEPCLPIEEHARRVMDWRNDPVTLAMFYHQEPKVWDSFWPEYRDDYFSNPALPPAFALLDDQPVAFFRFQAIESPSGIRPPTVDISVNLAPELRGQGIGVRALCGVGPYLGGRGINTVLAEVRKENEASRKAFVAAGWRPCSSEVRKQLDTGENCAIFLYVLEL